MKNSKKKESKPAVVIKETEYVPKCILPRQNGFGLVIGAKPNSK
jgi:hypothetical protein